VDHLVDRYDSYHKKSYPSFLWVVVIFVVEVWEGRCSSASSLVGGILGAPLVGVSFVGRILT